MDYDYSELSVDELKAIMRREELKNEHWKSCQDGSYEMALYFSAYSRAEEELNKRRTEYAKR